MITSELVMTKLRKIGLWLSMRMIACAIGRCCVAHRGQPMLVHWDVQRFEKMRGVKPLLNEGGPPSVEIINSFSSGLLELRVDKPHLLDIKISPIMIRNMYWYFELSSTLNKPVIEIFIHSMQLDCREGQLELESSDPDMIEMKTNVHWTANDIYCYSESLILTTIKINQIKSNRSDIKLNSIRFYLMGSKST